jgi:PPE-repeat protein
VRVAVGFGELSPEVNSGRMYSGPGSASLLAAAVSWDSLAAGLYDQAAEYESVTSGLAEAWRGPTATAMSQAVRPYLRWLNTAAGRAEEAARQARLAASANETAYAATVPPPVIGANRALRASLASTNHLGHTSAAIAAADAEYERMWAQDADAIYAYAGSAAAAAKVTPFPSPPSGIDPTALGYGAPALADADDVVLTGNQLIPTLPNALRTLSSSPRSASPLVAILPALAKLRTLRLSFTRVARAAAAASAEQAAGSGASVSAGLSRGAPLGMLSVPRAWFATATVPPSASPLPRYAWVSARW